MILIGSRAIVANYASFPRIPKDYDIVATLEEIKDFYSHNRDQIAYLVPSSQGTKFQCKLNDGTKIEFEVEDFIPSDQFLEEHFIHSAPCKSIRFHGTYLRVPTLDVLYLIKRSHIYWPVHWHKNIADLHFLKDVISHRWNENHKRFFELRITESVEKFGKKKINLKMSNEDFFAKSQSKVKRIVDHDKLHELFALGDRPAYLMAKADPTKASLDKDLFFNLPVHVQLNTVMEEAMVIGFERKVIPGLQQGKPIDLKSAYDYGLMRCSTTLSSGWWREFAIDNWPSVKKPQMENWILIFEKFKKSLSAFDQETVVSGDILFRDLVPDVAH
jgi:hypothetical protein